jgi:hypothetical protein
MGTPPLQVDLNLLTGSARATWGVDLRASATVGFAASDNLDEG